MISYYLVRPGSTQEGPFSEDELKGLYHQRTIPPGSYVWTEGWDQWHPCEDAFEWFISSAKLPPLPPHPGSEGTASHSNTSSAHAEQHEKSFSPDEMKASTAKEYRSLSDWMQNHEILNQIHRWGLRALQVKGQTYGINHYTVCVIGLMLVIIILSGGAKKPAVPQYESNAWIQNSMGGGDNSDYQLQQMIRAANNFYENNAMEICKKCGGSGVVTPGSGRALWNRTESNQYRMPCPQCGGAGEVPRSRNSGRFNDGTYQGSGW